MGVLWDIVCMTGEPLAYMLYRSAEEDAEEDDNSQS